ncbi:hypothetical protein [Leifsonia aquatica]|uniref:hypothetical protein n=1 Tax=Leifsonia aquatica TaxID=144185 RepID=UPI00380D653E
MVSGLDVDAMSKPDGTGKVSKEELSDLQASWGNCMKKVTGKLGERPVSESDKKKAKERDVKFERAYACLEAKGVDTTPKDNGDGTFSEGFSESNLPESVKSECGLNDLYGTAE